MVKCVSLCEISILREGERERDRERERESKGEKEIKIGRGEGAVEKYSWYQFFKHTGSSELYKSVPLARYMNMLL